MILALLLGCGADPKQDTAVTGDSAPVVDTDACGYGYDDADQDGYAGTWTYSCARVLSEVATDCDDFNAAVHPGAVEDCATIADDDCDGDSNDPGATGCTDWFTDQDADGYGAGAAQCRCVAEAPVNAAVGGDCADDDPEVWPGDGRCGLWGDVAYSDATATLIGEPVKDGQAGSAVAILGDLDGDGAGEIAVGTHVIGDNRGAVYVVAGVPVGDVALGDSADVLTGEAESWFGREVSGPGDLDGDGYGDLLAAAPGREDESAAAWYVPGPVGGSGPVSSVGSRLSGINPGIDLSAALLPEGVGAWITDAYDDATAGVWLVEGAPPDGAALSEVASAVVLNLEEGAASEAVVNGAGDVDGDGVGDLLSGMSHVTIELGFEGMAALWLGPFEGVRALEDADVRVLGDEPGGSLGSGAAFTGDNDGDGLDDWMIGGHNMENTRGVAMWFPADARGELGPSDAPARVTGATETGDDGSKLGHIVAGAGDQDRDGHADALVSVHGTSVAYLFAGPLEGALTGEDAAGSLLYDPLGIAGLSTSAGPMVAGDLNTDGWPDVLLGSAGDDYAEEDQGAAYLFMGGGWTP